MNSTTQDRPLKCAPVHGEAHSEVPVPANKGGLMRSASRAVLKGVTIAPVQSAALISVPAVAVWVALGSVGGFHASLTESLSENKPLKLGIVLLAAIYGLVATQTLAWIRDTLARQDREGQSAKAIQQIASDMQIDLDERSRSNDRLQRIERHVEDIGEVVATLATKNKPLTVLRKNSEEPWISLAPGSTYTSVGPQSLFDIETEKGPGDILVLTPNVERFERIILPRFDPKTALVRVNYVLFIGDADRKKSKKVPDAIRAQLIAFRTLKSMAAAKGIEPVLDRARFYLHPDKAPPKSFFVGQYLLSGTRVPFVNTYLNNAVMYRLPKCLLDDQVETTSVPAAVAEHEHLALILMSGLEALSIDDLENRFGDLVDGPNLNGLGIVRPRDRTVQLTSDVVDFGDGSFSIG